MTLFGVFLFLISVIASFFVEGRNARIVVFICMVLALICVAADVDDRYLVKETQKVEQ